MKSSVDEIRRRFDNDVERFSNLETGQTATIDARLALDLIATAAAKSSPAARSVLDVGCGAGNYTLRLLEELPGLEVTLVDLSRPMLDRAEQRVRAATGGRITSVQGDVRELPFVAESFDVVLAAAVLHHLRTDAEWDLVFRKIYDCLRPGGSFWIFDLVTASGPGIEALMQERYAAYLDALKGPEYRKHVLAYIEAEDTPRPLLEQLDRLRSVGFTSVEVLHKNGCFAAFGAVKR